MGEDHAETGDPQVEVTQEHVASEKQDDGHGDVGDEVGVTSIGDEIVVSPDKVDSLSAEPVSGDLSVVEETERAAPDDGVDEEKGDETTINEDNVVLPDKVDDSTAEPQSGDLNSVEETVTAAPDDGPPAADEENVDEASINNEKDKVDESSAEPESGDLSVAEETETSAPNDGHLVDEKKGDETLINEDNVVLPDKVDDSTAEPQSGDLSSVEETVTAAPDDGHAVDEKKGDEASINNEKDKVDGSSAERDLSIVEKTVVDEEKGDEASINNENVVLPDKVDDTSAEPQHAALADKVDDSSAEPEYGDLSMVEETETDVPVNALDDSVNVVEKDFEAVDSDGLSEAAVPKEDGSESGTAFTEEKEEETKAAEIQKSELDQTDDKVGELVEKQDGAASIDELAEDKSLENTELPTEENTAAAEFITQDDPSTEAVTSQEDEIKNGSAACTENEEENDGSAVEKVDEELQVVGQEDKAVEEVAPGEEKKIENASPEKPEDPAVPVVEKIEETAEPAIVEESEEVAEPVVVEENEELAEPSIVKPAEPVVEDAESDAVVGEAATEASQDSGEEKPEVVKSEELVTDEVDEHEQVQDREVGEDNVKVSDTTAEDDSSDAAAVASQEEETAGDAEGSKDIKNEHLLPLDEAAGKLEEQVKVDEKELLVTDGSVEEESVAKRSLEAFPPENSEDEVAISTGGDNTVEEEATLGNVDVEDSLKEEENTSIMVSQGDAGGADDSDDGGFVGTTHNSIGESLLLTDEEEVGPGKEVTMEDAATKENAVEFPTQESTPGNDEEKPAADLPENIRQDFVATSTENLEENTTDDRELVDFEGAQIQEEAPGDAVQLSEDKVADVEETEATSAENVNEDEQDETHEEVPSLQVECDKEATDASEQGADPGLDTAADVQPDVQINESLEKNGDEAFEQQTVVDKDIGGTVSAVEDETIEEGEAVKVEEEEGKGAEVEEGTADQKAIEVDHKEFEKETKGKVDAEVVDEPEPASKVVQAELEKDGGAELEEERAEEVGEVHADAEEATGEAGVEEEEAVKVSADEETAVDKEKEEGGEILNANESDGVAELGTQAGASPEECSMASETGSEVEVETVTGASSDYETTKKITFEEAPDAEQTAAPGATPEKDSEQRESEKVDEVQEAAHLPEGPVPVSTEREIHEDIVPTSDQEPAPVVEEKSAEKEEGQGDAEVEEETAGGVHADVEEGTPEAEIDEDGVKVSENTTVDRDIGEADTENDGESDDKTADGGAEVGTETEGCKENGIGNEVEASVGVDGLGNSDIQTTKKISFEEALFTDQEAQQQLSSAQAEGNKDAVIVGRESSPVAVSGDLEKSNTGARSMDSRGIVASALGSIVTAAMNLAKTTKPSKKKRLKLKKELAKQLQPV